MKNKLSDLNDHLFAQIERLADENLSAEKLAEEVKRGKAMAAVAAQIVNGASLQVQAAKLVAEKGNIRPLLPEAVDAARQIEAKPNAIAPPDRRQ